MIEEEWRYFAPSGAIFPGGPSTWHILDWDQRRIIGVTMDDYQESEDLSVQHLKKHIDALESDVYAISVSKDGDLASVSTDPKDDEATCVHYFPLEAIQLPGRVKTVLRSDLLELDRLTPNVDLVSYTPRDGTAETRAVFKYYFLFQFLHKLWHEMNLWIRLPPHPNIVPFDRLVLDELHGRIVGFTSLYISGGTLYDNTSRVFKLEWLRQLTRVVDDLNLKYGIVHQDIAARNLLLNHETDQLMLFDFNYSAQIGGMGGMGYGKDRDDVKGVIFTLYEIITRDMHFREVPHDQQNPDDVLGLEKWSKHPEVKLDHSVPEYRMVLDEWVKKRREGRQVATFTEAPEYIDWPNVPPPPEIEFTFQDIHGNPMIVKQATLETVRRTQREKGVATLNWERPPQNKLVNGDRVLANGQLVSGTERSGRLV